MAESMRPRGTLEEARALERRRQFVEAAAVYDTLGLPYEAAGAYFEARQWDEGFDALARADPADGRYSATCARAIEAAELARSTSFGLLHFLQPLLGAPHWTPPQRRLVHRVIALKEAAGDSLGAAGLARRLVLTDPRDDQAATILRRLTRPPVLAAPPAPMFESLATPAARPGPVAPPTGPTNAPGAARAPGFGPGQLVGQRYRLGDVLGRGGMSTVFHARDEELGDEVALKVFEASSGLEALERFRREIKLARDIVHPHVVRVFDLGLHEGDRYLTMELIDGVDLRQAVTRSPPLATRLDWVIQACKGLSAAHERGVVHRDVKPANLLITDRGVVKVTDFGVARHRDVTTELTTPGLVVGTAQYMAPEQIRGARELSFAADLYALGVVAYRLVTGHLPFPQTELVALFMAHLEAAPPPLRTWVPELPSAIEDVILRCLEKRPEDRWPSALALADALANVLRAG
ncbi:MAG: serine/threonine-protein kinase [Myxococcaceae bacterium]|nr:serine/threonine-protein kinase [Myxococcaceae bacterium]